MTNEYYLCDLIETSKFEPECWDALCKNKCAIHFIKENIHKITPNGYNNLLLIEDEYAIKMVENYINEFIGRDFWEADLDFTRLCANKNATYLVEKLFSDNYFPDILRNYDYYIQILSGYKHLNHILEKNFDKICCILFCVDILDKNEDVIYLLNTYFNDIINDPHKFNQNCWEKLCRNKNLDDTFIQFLETHTDKLNDICFENLCGIPNNSPLFMQFLENNKENLTYACWEKLLLHQNLPFIFQKFPEKQRPDALELVEETVYMKYMSINRLEILCKNKCETVLQFIQEHFDELTPKCWENLCGNQTQMAIRIVAKYPKKLKTPKCWENLCHNDYAVEFLKSCMNELGERLTKNAWVGLHFREDTGILDIFRVYEDQIVLEFLCENPIIFLPIHNFKRAIVYDDSDTDF